MAMANLSTKANIKYIPSLPGNRDLPDPLSFTIVAGLSMMEIRAWRDRLAALKFDKDNEAEIIKGFNAAFEGVVVLNGNHTIDSKPVNTIGDYLSLVGLQPGAPLMAELIQAITYNNSVEGLKEVFCVRSFGGTHSTAEASK